MEEVEDLAGRIGIGCEVDFGDLVKLLFQRLEEMTNEMDLGSEDHEIGAAYMRLSAPSVRKSPANDVSRY